MNASAPDCARRAPRRRRRFLPALLLALLPTSIPADIAGRVIAITDGDTVRVRDAAGAHHKVRLAGIDAPELGQPFGHESRRHLASLLAGKTVRVESTKTDRYGRVVGKVRVRPPNCADCAPTLDANLAQVRAGMAWWYEFYAHEQSPADRENYQAAVAEAKGKRRGLWVDANAVPPWAWRRGTRAPARGAAPAVFRCGGKRYCREMTSCAEAQFHLRRCGLSALDGDRNGVPCEALCR